MSSTALSLSHPQRLLDARVAATPDKPALIIGQQRWTFAELAYEVEQLTDALSDQVQPEQIVAVLMPNTMAYVALVFALARLEAVLLPLNTRLTSAELTFQLQHTECNLLLVDATTAEIAQTIELPIALVEVSPALTLSPLRKAAAPTRLPSDLPPNLQAIVFTSGTTGQPKGAMLTFDNHINSALASAVRLGLQPNDIWLSCLPLYHVGGLAVIWRSCLYGTAVSLHQRFILDAVNADLDAQPITLISVVPTMLHRLLESRTHWPASLRLILLGGAAATPTLVNRANALPRSASSQHAPSAGNDPLVATTYGLTEAASQVATLPPVETARKAGSVGKPLLLTSVRIVDDLGRDLPPNTPGEVVVSGPTVMAGYFRRPQATAETLRGGALHTGDIGYLDEDGDLWLVQRRSDIIVTGGENVYPAEVEQALRQHPAVKAVCVVGVADDEWGHTVAAMVVVQDGISAESLTQFARQQLAGYKIPRLWQLVDALPLTASGKVSRKQVQEMFPPNR